MLIEIGKIVRTCYREIRRSIRVRHFGPLLGVNERIITFVKDQLFFLLLSICYYNFVDLNANFRFYMLLYKN